MTLKGLPKEDRSLDDFNPYAPPLAPISSSPIVDALGQGRGVWRDGSTLVMHPSALLPHRCVQCNAPARRLLDQTLTQREATIRLPLCLDHWSRHRKDVRIMLVCLFVGILLCFGSAIDRSLLFLVGAGAGLILFGLIYGTIRTSIVRAKKIDATYVWLDKVCPSYLEALPPFSGSIGSPSKPEP